MRKPIFALLVLTLICQLATAQNKTSSLPPTEASALSPFINQYQADENMLNRKYTLKRSEEYFQRMQRFYSEWIAKLKALPFEKLSVNERVDYILLKRDINVDAKNLQDSYTEFKNTNFTIPFAQTIIDFEQKRRIGTQQNGAVLNTAFEKLKTDINTISKSVNSKQLALNPIQANWAEQTVNQYLTVFNESYKFYDGYDPQFTKATKTSYQDAARALKDYADGLGKMAKLSIAKDDGSGILGNPIGRTAFLSLLNDEMIAYTPEQIEAIARREFAWCDAEMLKASAAMGFGNDWKKALEKVKTDYPALGKQPEFVYELANEAINFVEQNKLLDVPEMAKEGWRMRMLTPQEQLYAPFFLGGESVLIAYPTEDMSEEAKMMTLRGNNRHFSRAVVFHELIPGHNLQYFMQSR
ncbi:MAG TPA: DUF885 family protein, partial [Pedobacter sp.]|nr:DUF885 family protein [Pedobacter sp.]